MLRAVRIAVTFFALAAGCLLVAMWVRSYTTSDYAAKPITDQRALLVSSKQGRAIVWLIRERWDMPFRRARMSPAVNSPFPRGDVRKHESFMGFGTVKWPTDVLALRPTNVTHLMAELRFPTRLTTPPSPPTGSGVIIPYWFLVLLCGTIAALPRLRWPPRITLRGLFIAMTFASLLLGLVGWLDLGQMR